MARIDRLVSVIKREIADILLKRLHHREVGVISILDVKLSKDLRHAKVAYSQFGNEEARKKTKMILDQAKGFIRAELGKALFTQVIPDLTFEYDDSIERAQTMIDRIDELSQQ